MAGWGPTAHGAAGVEARIKCVMSPGKEEAGPDLKARAGMMQPPSGVSGPQAAFLSLFLPLSRLSQFLSFQGHPA